MELKDVLDWRSVDPNSDYPSGFRDWINSINKDFLNRGRYEPFELYVQEAEGWLSDNDRISNHRKEESIKRYIAREILRCRRNTLYFINKYWWLKDGFEEGGRLKCQAWEAQKIILYIFDLYLSGIFGKPLRVGFTSVIAGAFIKRINFHPNYLAIYAAFEKEKGERIFNATMRWGFLQIPQYLRAKVWNMRDNLLGLGDNPKSPNYQGLDSKCFVVTPNVYASTGEAPNLVGLDEIGLNSEFSLMLSEMRPALFKFNPETGLMERRRQLLLWGTGGAMDTGGAAFEDEWRAAVDNWNSGNWQYGLIPIFFDAFARPGVTKEFYLKEKKDAESHTGTDAIEKKNKFRQHYPINPEDMFLRTAKTMLPPEQINSHIIRINTMRPELAPAYGYFVPKKDVNKKIIGAEWIPTELFSDNLTTTCIYRPPKPGWKDRYYKGTDPIDSESGRSKFSSSIWDEEDKTVSALMNWRVRDYKAVFEQSLLLGLYYGGPDIKELIEINMGAHYADYIEQQGYGHTLIMNSELPEHLQIKTGNTIGINNRGQSVPKHIVYSMMQMLDSYADNICIPDIFIQLKTFVEKSTNATNRTGYYRWQAENLKYHYDDALYASTYSFIAASCYERYRPIQIQNEQREKTMRRFIYDDSWTLRLAVVTESGRFIKWAPASRM